MKDPHDDIAFDKVIGIWNKADAVTSFDDFGATSFADRNARR